MPDSSTYEGPHASNVTPEFERRRQQQIQRIKAKESELGLQATAKQLHPVAAPRAPRAKRSARPLNVSPRKSGRLAARASVPDYRDPVVPDIHFKRAAVATMPLAYPDRAEDSEDPIKKYFKQAKGTSSLCDDAETESVVDSVVDFLKDAG